MSWCLAPLVLAVAAAPPLHFERVGPENGPLPDVITVLRQDRTGFLWIGSRRGLFLYDGYSFREFKNDPADPTSISDHAIRSIVEDSKGRLWIGTNAGGLELLDRARWSFEHFRHDSQDPSSISHDSVNEIVEDRDGALWVATQRGLNRFDPAGRRFERVGAGGEYVLSLSLDTDGKLWIATVDGGLSCLDPVSRRLETFRHDPADPRSIAANEVFVTALDAGGRVWVGTTEGLDRWDPASRSFVHSAIRSVNVTSIVSGPSGRLWVGTFGGGLQELDPETGAVTPHRSDPARRDALANDRIVVLLAGSDDTLWVGTWGGGLQRIPATAFDLAAASARAQLPAALESNDITALLSARDGSLWLGTGEGEVVRRDPIRGEDRKVVAGAGQILALAEDRTGRTWVGASTGLVALGPGPGQETRLKHAADDPLSLGRGYVRAILEDTKGRIWVGTGEGGVQRIDPDGRVRVRFVHEAGNPGTLSDNYVLCLREGREGKLWVGTRSGGLNELDVETGAVTRHPSPHKTITAIHEDGGGRLWVGTAGGGLQLVERDEGGAVRFTRYTQADGLVDDDVVAILEEGENLWLATRKGLTRFDPSSGSVVNYGAAEGIAVGEFEVGAAASTKEALYFGGVRGLAAIPAGMPFRAARPAPTVLTAFRTAGGELRGDAPAWTRSKLEVPYGTSLTLDIAVLDFDTPDHDLYAYRLRPDQPWVDLGPRRSVTFAGLAPGTHAFTARGRSGRGVWSETPPLEITVLPRFWMTWWFRLGAVGLVAAAALGAHRMRTASLARRNRQLVELQSARERAQADLRAAYERLRHLTRRFEAAKEEERKRIARELHDDLGPSLTAVIINLQLGSTERLAEATELVDRIIQQIRDLSLALRPPLLDEMGLVPALKGYLETTAERTGLDLTFRGEPSLEGLPGEVEITAFRVAQEAITNVVRHARARKVTTSIDRDDGRLVVSVEDDGVGFDVASTIGTAATGNAVGLLGMTERVSLLGGNLAIESSPGRGTRVRVELPLEAGR